jgi:hypothetical protein
MHGDTKRLMDIPLITLKTKHANFKKQRMIEKAERTIMGFLEVQIT